MADDVKGTGGTAGEDEKTSDPQLEPVLENELNAAIEPVVQEFGNRLARVMRREVEQVYRMNTNQVNEDQTETESPPAEKRPRKGGTRPRRGTTTPESGQDTGAAQNSPSNEGGSQVTAEAQDQQTTGTDETNAPSQSSTSDQPQGSAGSQEASAQKQGSNGGTPARGNTQPKSSSRRQGSKPTYVYNPKTAVQAGLVNLATQWKESGAIYQAIHAYTEVLTNYPNTGAAAAATEGLLDLARRMEQEGRFYAALDIFHKLEVLV